MAADYVADYGKLTPKFECIALIAKKHSITSKKRRQSSNPVT